MVRSREEMRKLVRWPRVGRVRRLRLPAESRGENRLHKPDAVLSPGRHLQQPRALPRTAPQIDPLQPGTLEFPVSQIPAAQARSPKRSEERRVGKECRSGWGRDRQKQKER